MQLRDYSPCASPLHGGARERPMIVDCGLFVIIPAGNIDTRNTMTLRVGDSFGLEDLPSAAAYDRNGMVESVVPILISRTSGHESVDWSGQDQRWHVVAPGEVEVTVSGACPKHEGLRAVLTIVIHAPSPDEASERIEGSTTDGNAP